MVVTYDDHLGGGGGGGGGGIHHSPVHQSPVHVQQKLSSLKNKHANYDQNQSIELRGSSHHLAVEGDVIRGDELDSLLNKARNIRGMN